ncbi:MAG: MBOAT family O-acyltransferase [Anaerovoracaceae bacterium]
MKNAVLFAGSMCFYFSGTVNNPEHFILLLASIAVDFSAGILMSKFENRKKMILTAGILFHLTSIFVYKYSGFLLGEISSHLGTASPAFDPVMPIGISFYTFQGISYLADVYRGKVKAEESLLGFGVYISMFEQLIAGPIVTYDCVAEKLHHREIKKNAAIMGLAIFIIGLGLKVLLANPVGKLWTDVKAIGFESISTPLAWMSLAAFSFQIYFDFFGYSLMAVGLGKMVGFDLPENFRLPYVSRSMTEFWRRWHITLGSWFREYVYIPLGGNRLGRIGTVRNLLAVWLLTGIWHGAGYNFILWGMTLFLIIASEKYLTGSFLARNFLASRVYMIILIPLTWAVFAIEDMDKLAVFFSRLFPFFGDGVWSVFRYDYLKYLKMYWPFLIICLVMSAILPQNILKHVRNRLLLWTILAAILAACIYCMYRGLDDPFLYFRF